MISYSVMASEERKDFLPYLKKELGNVPFLIDKPRGHKKNIGIWENCKRSWRANKGKKYHCVIQDDAILTKDFKNKVSEFISKIDKEKGEFAYQLFYMGKHEIPECNYIVKHEMMFGVAIVLPTRLIEEMIKFGDKLPIKEDDVKISLFLKKIGIKTIYPIPCFVDHRTQDEAPTLTGIRANNRVSNVFKQ